MKQIILFLILCIPATAFAQKLYDVSCNNIKQIRIVRVDVSNHWNVESYNGYFHILSLDIKTDALNEYRTLRDTTPTNQVSYRGEIHTPYDILVTANGRPLRNDHPAMTTFTNQGITIGIIREKDAFEAARSICPALVPGRVLIDGQLE